MFDNFTSQQKMIGLIVIVIIVIVIEILYFYSTYTTDVERQDNMQKLWLAIGVTLALGIVLYLLSDMNKSHEKSEHHHHDHDRERERSSESSSPRRSSSPKRTSSIGGVENMSFEGAEDMTFANWRKMRNGIAAVRANKKAEDAAHKVQVQGKRAATKAARAGITLPESRISNPGPRPGVNDSGAGDD